MKREIKNDGVYMEVDASEILDNLEALEEAKIIVVTSARIELAGEEKLKFMKLLEAWDKHMSENDPTYTTPEFNSRQKSDIVFRTLLLSGLPQG